MCELVGAFGIVWFIFWHTMVYEKPNDHPRIDQDELSYIRNSISECSKRRETKRVGYYLKVHINSQSQCDEISTIHLIYSNI